MPAGPATPTIEDMVAAVQSAVYLAQHRVDSWRDHPDSPLGLEAAQHLAAIAAVRNALSAISPLIDGSADDVERAREVMADAIIDEENPAWNARTVQAIAAALTAARREERVRCVELIGRWETENVRLIHERDAAIRALAGEE